MIENELKKYLVTWVKNITFSNKVLFNYQNEPRFKDLFFVLTKISTHKITPVDEQQVQNDGTIKVYKVRVLNLSISAYNTAANEKLSLLWESLSLESIRQDFRANGISILKVDDLLDLSYVNDSVYVEKANFSLELMFVDESIDDVGYFDKVEIHGTYKNDETIILEQDITVHLNG